jgi:uncharacterized membrane protein
MRLQLKTLAALPLLILGVACADEHITSPGDALSAKGGGGGGSTHDVIVLPGGNGNAAAINDAGVIVGHARDTKDGTEPYPALRWVASSTGVTGPENLGTVPSPNNEPVVAYVPQAINSSGVIVGYFQTHTNRFGAWVYTDESGMQLLPWMVGSTWEFRAHAINDRGVVVGFLEYSVRDEDGTLIDRVKRAAVWPTPQHQPLLLPPLEGHDATWANAISMDGLVTGFSYSRDGIFGYGEPQTGVTWRINEAGELIEGPAPVPTGFFPGAVNQAGDIAGRRIDPTEAAVMRSESMLRLDALVAGSSSAAMDISDPGAGGLVRVAGWSGDRAVLWTIDAADVVSAPLDLGLPKGSAGAYANGINAHGWVVGGSRSPHGDRPTLWLPRASSGGGEECEPHPKHPDNCR